MTMDIDELDRVTDTRGNGYEEHDTEPAPPGNDVLFEMLKGLSSKVALLVKEDKDREERDLRLVTMVQEIHNEMFRNASKGTP